MATIERLYYAGLCMICHGGEDDVVVLLERVHRQAVFFCQTCWSAWRELPNAEKWTPLTFLHGIAQQGVSLPRDRDLDRLDLWSSIVAVASMVEGCDQYEGLQRALCGELSKPPPWED